MKLSKRGEYALRALIDLGIASELGWPMLQVSELAAKEKLPTKFLEQIFAQLKAAGYVESRRGKFGGYSLARPMNRCVSQTSYARCSCPDEVHCGLRMLMLDVRNAIAKLLDRYTLADIVEITLRKFRRDKVTPPFLHRSIPLTSVLSRTGEPPIRSRRTMGRFQQFSTRERDQSYNNRAKSAANSWQISTVVSMLVLTTIQPLTAQTPSESKRLEKLERAVEQLQQRNAELEQEVSSLKKHAAVAPDGAVPAVRNFSLPLSCPPARRRRFRR